MNAHHMHWLDTHLDAEVVGALDKHCLMPLTLLLREVQGRAGGAGRLLHGVLIPPQPLAGQRQLLLCHHMALQGIMGLSYAAGQAYLLLTDLADRSLPVGTTPMSGAEGKACTRPMAGQSLTMGAHGMLVLSWARISSMTSALARLPPPRACWAAPLSSCISMGSRSSSDSCGYQKVLSACLTSQVLHLGSRALPQVNRDQDTPAWAAH